MGIWFLSTIWIESRDLPIMETLRSNTHFGSTLRLRSTTQKLDDGFKAGVWQSGELSQEACTTDLVLILDLTVRPDNPWNRGQGPHHLGVWIYSAWLHMCPGFCCGPQGLAIWGAHWAIAGYPGFMGSTGGEWEDSVNMVCITNFSFKVNFMRI